MAQPPDDDLFRQNILDQLGQPDAQFGGAGGPPPDAGPSLPLDGGPDGTLTGGIPAADEPPAVNDLDWRKSLRSKALGSQSGQSFGWNTGDYGGDDVAANSVKNTFHAIAQRYPSTPSGLKQMMADPDFQRAFPNAKRIEHPTGDKIDFGGVLSDFSKGTPVGVVDVGRAFSGEGDTGEGWDWMPEGGGEAPMLGPDEAMLGGVDLGAEDGGLLAQILAELQAQAEGSPETGTEGGDPFRDALLQELQ